MKSSEEMTRNVLKRGEEYFARRKKKRGAAAVAGTAALSVLTVSLACFGTWNTAAKRTENAATGYEGTAGAEETVQTDDASDSVGHTGSESISDEGLVELDMAGTICIDGVWYVQKSGSDPKEFTKKDFLGKASEYNGAYKILYERDGIDGDVYSVSESPDTVLIFLTNGGTVVLTENREDWRISLPEKGNATALRGEVTDEEADAYLEQNRAGIVNLISKVSDDPNVTLKGYKCVICSRDGGTVERISRYCLVFAGENPVAEYELEKEDGGTVSGRPIAVFGQGKISEAFKKHKDEDLIFFVKEPHTFVITPENKVFLVDISSLGLPPEDGGVEYLFAVDEGFDVYGYFKNMG